MWETPTAEKLSLLKLQGLSDTEMANYFGCTLQLVKAYLKEFQISQHKKPKRKIFKNTYKKPLASKKNYRRRSCLRCQKHFCSDGCHNRICNNCKDTPDFRALGKQYESC
jgi:predicted transcriptional regulator